jgi:hypothetical protein
MKRVGSYTFPTNNASAHHHYRLLQYIFIRFKNPILSSCNLPLTNVWYQEAFLTARSTCEPVLTISLHYCCIVYSLPLLKSSDATHGKCEFLIQLSLSHSSTSLRWCPSLHVCVLLYRVKDVQIEYWIPESQRSCPLQMQAKTFCELR